MVLCAMVCIMDCEHYEPDRCFLKWLNGHNLIPNSRRDYLTSSQEDIKGSFPGHKVGGARK
jgi:hypothetical protein